MSTDYKKIFGQKDIILTNTDRDRIGSEVESVEYMSEYFNKKRRFIPPVDFSKPKYFARFGSAEKYFIDAVDRIYKTYPYDGSLRERIQWELSSSYLDLDVFENGYPRTNGYVIFSAEEWGTQTDAAAGYGATATASYEYISIKGGPHTSNRATGKDIQDTLGDYGDGYANVWDPAKNRESNLKIGGIDGNTVEFWLKRSSFLGTSLTNQEVIFDLYTSQYESSSANYGRLTVELTAAASGSPFKITYMSGAAGFGPSIVGSDLEVSSVTDDKWHHYAVALKNTGSTVEVNFFVDGACNQTITTGSSINYVSGNLNASIGALANAPSGTAGQHGESMRGWGKLSASLDEFRFWKTARTSQQVGRQHIEPVGGGTNTDDANTTLGVYYKFNEGITLTASTDKSILDYSGRISNGNFQGYNSSARSTGSAMVSSGKVNSEFKDPILYSFHPDVVSYRNTKKLEGRDYDYSNNASIYHSLPAWIIEEDEAEENSSLRNLTQIVGSYFDTLASQIESVPKFKHKNYLSASFKPYPFSDRLLESVGFSYFPELFSDATALQHFRNRDDASLFKQKLYDVKNRIYQNIYNNIVYIYKTKGTEKSFRNLIRCFGLDSEVYKINLYGHRVTHQLKDNHESTAEFKKYANFSLINTQNAVVFPFSSSTNPNSTSFISASQNAALEATGGLALTMQTEVAFPIRHSLAASNTIVAAESGSSKSFRAYSPFKSASLFGVHQVEGATENNLTWAGQALAEVANIITIPAGFANDDRFTVNVPSTVGGAGTNITVRLVTPGDPSDGTANEVQVGATTAANTAARLILAINGLNSTVVKYGPGSGDVTNGIAGITAAAGTGNSITITASKLGADANDITFTDVEGTMVEDAGTGASPATLTGGASDYANFQVFAVRDEEYSKRCKFLLTGTVGSIMPTLSSSYFDGVFDDTRWTFSVAIKPSNYPEATLPSGTLSSSWDVEFYGIEKVLDTTKNEFFVTSSIDRTAGARFMTSPKSVYVGAHRLNFSGALKQRSDGNISSTRVWMTYIPTGTIKQHAQDVKNYGPPNPYRSAYLYQTTMSGTRVPEIHTLALNWTFDTLSSSDDSGEFVGQDFSSGSVSLQNRYNWIGDVIGKQYLPKGYGFPTNSSNSINRKYVYSAKKQLPEMVNSSDMVNILDDDDKFFNKDNLMRPTKYYMYIEKSMYQSISEEIIKIFSSIKDFNNLIGEPVNKYRDKYKHMEKLRQIFFERVNNTPDLDKYIDFYKWVDQTLDSLLGDLVPASADISDQYGSNIRTLVESHVLERNKYKWQFPTLEDKTPSAIEGRVLGINELTYNWEFGHDPVNDSQSDKCFWWKERAERTDALSSGDTNVDNDKQTILNSINNETNASNYTLYDNSTSTTYSGSTFAVRRLAKPYKFKIDKSHTIRGGTNYYPNKQTDIFKAETDKDNSLSFLAVDAPSVESFKDCNDDLDLIQKRKHSFRGYLRSDVPNPAQKNSFLNAKGALFSPFSMYSASISGGYYDTISNNFKAGVDITNLHEDIYGSSYEIPLQGPFTEKHVGGLQYRHIIFNTGSDNRSNRPEGWSLTVGGNTLYFYGPAGSGGNFNVPKANRFRDETAKRPVNIRNIRQTTGSTMIGNYTKDYEILMTAGRAINNRYFVKNEGVSASATDVFAVSGVLDYNLPGGAKSAVNRTHATKNGFTSSARNDYIIVNRFSAPGDPSTMGLGFLDIESQEYSVYNALPWRNLIVRESLHELFIDHTKQFGFFSDAQNSASWVLAGETYPGTNGSVSAANYEGSASFHKVNRNPRRVIKFNGTGDEAPIVTGTTYDNWYIQHQIPQTDLQYAWITSSIVSDYTGSALFGFEQPNFDNASLASTDITFCSASEVGSGQSGATRYWYAGGDKASAGLVPTDFAGLNTNIYESLTASANTIGYDPGTVLFDYAGGTTQQYANRALVSNYLGGTQNPGEYDYGLPRVFNALILHRQGPYGWPSWKQTRGGNHPVIRAHRKENRQSFLTMGAPLPAIAADGSEITPTSMIIKKSIVSQIVPPLTSKYRPITQDLQIKTSWGDNPTTDNITIRHAYGNEKNTFPQVVSGAMDLNKATFISVVAGHRSGELLSSRAKPLIYDSLYSFFTDPGVAGSVEKFNNLVLEETVYPREYYTYLKNTRQRNNFENGFWRDARSLRDQYFENAGLNSQDALVSQSMWPLDARSNTGQSPLTGSEGIEGELQNGYNLFFNATDGRTNLRTPFAAATYSRRIPESTDAGSGPGTGVCVFAGDTKWEAASQAGVNPFYDDYNSYVEELKRIGKDYGIVPEFRISEQMEYIQDNGGDFNSPPLNKGWLSLTGSTVSSSADETFYTVYTYSDFMKYFKVVQTDYSPDRGVIPSELTLECEALIKFLPYDGFYPAQRTVQLAKLFSQSYGPSAELTGDDANFRTMVAPFFSPGLLYNSIKSGLAVDYPIATGTLGTNLFITGSDHNNTQDRPGDARLSGAFDFRLPFETLLSPWHGTEVHQVIDTEPHPTASIDSTASFGGEDTPLYRYAINNFLAEVPSFFLEGGGLSTLQSIKDINTIEAQADKEYKMRIVCHNGKASNLKILTDETKGSMAAYRINQTASFIYNEPQGAMYHRTFDTGSGTGYRMRHVGENNRTLAYGSSFGPPCDAPYRETRLGAEILSESSFEPFTPPYYNGYSHIEFTWTPSAEGKKDITDMANSTISLHRECTRESGSGEGTCAGNNAMSLTASLNYKQVVSTPDPLTGDVATGGDSWVIQPKWECPILDFSGSSIELPEGGGSGSVAKGMWHQYTSTVPVGDAATYLSIQDVPGHDPDLSLRKLLGYNDNNNSVQLGVVSNEGKTVREAVVAIPFIPNLNNPGGKDYFYIDTNTILWAKDAVTLEDPNASEFDKQKAANSISNFKDQSASTWKYKPAQSVIDMVKTMQKYVIPPQFDFLRKGEYDSAPDLPFAMFLFEFETKLTQKDLINIWQNLPPDDINNSSIGNKSLSQAVTKKASAPFNWPGKKPLNLTKRKDLLIQSAESKVDNWKGFDILNDRPAEGTQKYIDEWTWEDIVPEGPTDTGDFNKGYPHDIQWMVFKVKQKAKTNYYDLTAKIEEPASNWAIPHYSYNWPYDFFSLVELIKLNVAYKFEDNPTVAFEWDPGPGDADPAGDYKIGSAGGFGNPPTPQAGEVQTEDPIAAVAADLARLKGSTTADATKAIAKTAAKITKASDAGGGPFGTGGNSGKGGPW